MPRTGTVSVVSTPADARWDSGIESGSVITPFYDSMIGKLIVHGADRDAARRRLVAALDQVLIAGVRTNVGFQRWLLMQDPIVAGRVTTRFLDESPLPDDTTHDENRALAAIAWLAALEQAAADGDVWRRMGRRRFTPHTSMTSVLFEDLDGATVEVLVGGTSASFRVEDGATYDDVSLRAGCLRWTSEAVTMTAPAHVDRTLRRVAVALRGHTETFVLRDHVGAGRGEGGSLGTANAVVAPFPALVAEVHVRPGDAVRAGQVVIVLEAMKILHSLAASGDGVVASVRVVPGEQVASRDVLITFEEADDGRPDDGK
jgi:acetyl/propionyl-CoA carboxylase alpha subunit